MIIYVNEIIPNSDVVFIHAEIDEEIHDIYRMIKEKGRKFGVVFSMSSSLNEIEPFLKLSPCFASCNKTTWIFWTKI